MRMLYMLIQSCKFSVSYKGPFSIKKQKFKIDFFSFSASTIFMISICNILLNCPILNKSLGKRFWGSYAGKFLWTSRLLPFFTK